MEKNSADSAVRKKRRILAAFLLLAAAMAAGILLNICIGSVSVSLSEILKILSGQPMGEKQQTIILQLRLPRTILAAVLGGALALSGYLLQTFFHNPIAGPFVLGISSGAKMVVALVMVFFLGRGRMVNSAGMIAAAFAGAMLSMGFVLLMSRRIRRMSMLVVRGVMIGYICSAITDFVVTFADDSDIVNLHGWSLGSFSGSSWSNIRVAAVIVAVAAVWTFLLSKPIGAYQLGEHYAQSMGVNIQLFRILIILLSSVLSACVTAFAGPISFVGIAVPFLTRKAFGTSKPIVIIPGTFFAGAVFCMSCDLIARMALAPVELNISTVTSIVGAPIVIYMMVKREKGR